MKRNILFALALLITVVLVFTGCNPITVYNNCVAKQVSCDNAWAQVENVYQRRLDLIPNLVNVVKGYAKHEKETLEGVIKMRSQATSITLTKEALEDPKAFENFQKVQGDISSALSKLLMITENYPDLKANTNFLALQTQLEGTENRISVERKRYNDVVMDYNTYIQQFPNNIIAGNKFKPRQMFTAQKGSETAPVVNFD
jgi:LemA protein